MKYECKRPACFFLSFLLIFCFAPFACGEEAFDPLPAFSWGEITETGPADSSVSYPVLYAYEIPEAAALAEKINETIQAGAQLPAYLQMLPGIQEGGTGLNMTYKTSCSCALKTRPQNNQTIAPYISILFSARGKMLRGRPSQVYYPMTLNLKTGEAVAFDSLFTDPEGAMAYMEAALEREVEPTLSTYLENSQLFPVPWDRFYLDGFGNLILCYENSQLSFLSGTSGAVAFRYSELWDWLDTSAEGVPMQVLWHPEKYLAPCDADEWNFAEKNDEWLSWGSLYGLGAEIYVGGAVKDVLALYPAAADSDAYPGGACIELEDAALRGTLLLTDEAEETVTGLLTARVDHFGINTGKTTLADAERLLGDETPLRIAIDEATAAAWRVCPGAASVYSTADREGRALSFTLYADENGVVQYLKLSLQ